MINLFNKNAALYFNLNSKYFYMDLLLGIKKKDRHPSPALKLASKKNPFTNFILKKAMGKRETD